MPGKNQSLSLQAERHLNVKQGVHVNGKTGSLSNKRDEPVSRSFQCSVLGAGGRGHSGGPQPPLGGAGEEEYHDGRSRLKPSLEGRAGDTRAQKAEGKSKHRDSRTCRGHESVARVAVCRTGSSSSVSGGGGRGTHMARFEGPERGEERGGGGEHPVR